MYLHHAVGQLQSQRRDLLKERAHVNLLTHATLERVRSSVRFFLTIRRSSLSFEYRRHAPQQMLSGCRRTTDLCNSGCTSGWLSENGGKRLDIFLLLRSHDGVKISSNTPAHPWHSLFFSPPVSSDAWRSHSTCSVVIKIKCNHTLSRIYKSVLEWLVSLCLCLRFRTFEEEFL